MSSWMNKRSVNRQMRLSTISVNNIFTPTFHILIATAGRSSLLQMLNSLKYQLTENDAITIVFDGENSLKQSLFNNSWLTEHKSKINIIEQIPNLGYWGHGIRNKYQAILEPKTTFIMHADDDDIYAPNSFQNLRKMCVSPNILYIAQFLVKSKKIIVPSQSLEIIQNDIGTPCGIIPFDIAHKSIWEHRYGGDFNYYNSIKNVSEGIKFLNTIIYYVN